MKSHRVEARVAGSVTKSKERGMTLIEILAVVTLIGLIFVVVARGVFGKSAAAQAKLNIVKMEKVRQALSQFQLEYNTYPEKLEDLVKPSATTTGSGTLFIPTLSEKDEDLLDIWKQAFRYKSENNGRSYSLTSLGADGAPGGEGPNTDVTMKP